MSAPAGDGGSGHATLSAPAGDGGSGALPATVVGSATRFVGLAAALVMFFAACQPSLSLPHAVGVRLMIGFDAVGACSSRLFLRRLFLNCLTFCPQIPALALFDWVRAVVPMAALRRLRVRRGEAILFCARAEPALKPPSPSAMSNMATTGINRAFAVMRGPHYQWSKKCPDQIRFQCVANATILRLIDDQIAMAAASSGRPSRVILHTRSQPPDRRQPAAVLASVKDKPSAALKKRRP